MKKFKKILKEVYPTIALLCLIVIGLNFSFFHKQVKYFFKAEEAVEMQQKGQPDLLQISSLGVSAPLIYVTERNEDAFQEALADGVVHYPETAKPGEYGNAYFFGHSSDFPWAKGNYKTVFALLPKIKVGDEIEISDSQGNVFRYYVTETLVVAPNDLSVLDQFGRGKQLLSLQTSYPIGTALKRLVVRAEMRP